MTNNKAKLAPRERAVLAGRVAGRTLDDLAREFQISRERARQVECTALYKMLHHHDPAVSARLTVVVRSLLDLVPR